MSNKQMLHETESRPITSIVHQHQVQLLGHVARYPEVNPAFRVVSERDIPAWRRPRGRPRTSWLGQVDASCWELLNMGRGPAWRLAWKNPRDWRHRVGVATHPWRMPLLDREPGGVSLAGKVTNSNPHSNNPCACPCMKMKVCRACSGGQGHEVMSKL